ncbi:MAG: glucose-6-phosphate isomerase [Patescibacteria group bacterium]
MDKITIESKGIDINGNDFSLIKSEIAEAYQKIEDKSGAGNEMLGWADLPSQISQSEIVDIRETAEKIKDNSDAFIVIGIGGSYLGSRAVIEALKPSFFNSLPKKKRDYPEIYFAGNNISGKYLSDLLHVLEGKDISINVISKSGTTTEPAIAFRVFKEYLENKYGKDEAAKRIIVTTDKEKGSLKKLAGDEGYKTFVIPDNIGGRYSVLTPVGLLPIAVAGIDIDELIGGAKASEEDLKGRDTEKNDACIYAAVRNLLYRQGKSLEILVNYEPSLHYFAEWWKQLFGESEGKGGAGIFPASVDFTTDLHSLGQYIQAGKRNLFETVLNIRDQEQDIPLGEVEGNIDGLNFLAGKSINFVNQKALEATVMAHTDGGVPNIIINIPKINAYYLGNLIYFFEKACAISAYTLGVNPFDQPGVETYKNKMFSLLGKPGYEELKPELEKRI